MTLMRLGVRAVNGWGPRCACGDESVLHLQTGGARKVAPETSRFYCVDCAGRAFEHFDKRTGRTPYWPGDEGRDEPYESPHREG